MPLPAGQPTVIRFGAFELDAVRGELRKGGLSLKMHPQPFRVLQLLTERSGQIVTREEIRRCLWGSNTFVDFDRGINFCVNQIRAALADNAENPRYIETLPRRGYRFIASSTIARPTKHASLFADEPVPQTPNSSEQPKMAARGCVDLPSSLDIHVVPSSFCAHCRASLDQDDRTAHNCRAVGNRYSYCRRYLLFPRLFPQFSETHRERYYRAGGFQQCHGRPSI